MDGMVAEFSLKGGEIPKAIKKEEFSGRINLREIDIIRFRHRLRLHVLKSIRLYNDIKIIYRGGWI